MESSLKVPLLPSSLPILSAFAKSTRLGSSRSRLFFLFLCLFLFSYLYSLITAYNYSQPRYKARIVQKLVGFPEERMNTLNVPTDLLDSSLSAEQLLQHPLLGHVEPLDCGMTSYHRERYAPLFPGFRQRSSSSKSANRRNLPHHQLNYLIAINLIDAANVFPTLLRAIYSLIKLTEGSSPRGKFHISIYENGSKDDTPVQLYLLARLFQKLGLGYTIISSVAEEGKTQGSRISKLSALRNEALKPVFDNPAGTFDRIIFLNDVHLCETDLLELLFSNEVQEADMSCGMDYKDLEIPEFKDSGYPLIFYDTWVARDMAGLPFYKITQPGGSWSLPSDPLTISPSRFRFQSLLPFQVYSCWNGVTVLRASLFLPPYDLRFRTNDNTDVDSECYLICKDLWKALAPWRWSAFVGEGSSSLLHNESATLIDKSTQIEARGARIQVVPRASVGYTALQYGRARKDRNTTAWAELDGEDQFQRMEVFERDEAVDWSVWPPKRVAHYPYARWHEETWISPL